MKENIIKSGIACLLMIVVLGSFPVVANAFSIQVRGGAGEFSTGGEGGKYSQAGADIFVYEGRNLELFLGAESLQGTSPNVVDRGLFIYGGTTGTMSNAACSFKYTAVTYGLRLKPAMSGRWKPYLALGGIGGTADYEVTDVRNFVLLSKSKDSANFVGGRVGLGMDIGISRRASLGIEANATGTTAAFKAVVASSASGEVKEIKLTEGVNMFGVALGLRYAF